jgi:RNA polymerase sigma-70 factor (ECF subfamily)
MSLEEDLIAQTQNLRAFARSLVHDQTRADDLVQETILKAWSNLGSFKEGTNMRAWLFTILRNTFYSEIRKHRREVEDIDGRYAAQVPDKPTQHGIMDLRDFNEAFATLPADQREALTLVGASGFSYEEAAAVCGCAVGTVKSRVNRARSRLVEILHANDEKGPSIVSEGEILAAMGAGSVSGTKVK